MLRNRNVQIVATLGPASSSYQMVRDLQAAGADVFRLKMSHGQRKSIIRRPICILADLQGPKLRFVRFKDERIGLEQRAAFRLSLNGKHGDFKGGQLPQAAMTASGPRWVSRSTPPEPPTFCVSFR